MDMGNAIKTTLSVFCLSSAALASSAVVACGAFGAADAEPASAPDAAASDGAATADAPSASCNGGTTFGGDMSSLPAGFTVSPAPASPPSFEGGQMVASASIGPSAWGSSTISRFFVGSVSSVDASWTATLPASDIQAEVGCRIHLTVVPSNETIRLYFVHNGLASFYFVADRLSSPAVGVADATLAAPHGPGTFPMALGAKLSNGTLSLRAEFNGKAHKADVALAETIQRAEVICGLASAYNGSTAADTFAVQVDTLSGTVCPAP
jgi:hypothetical protein